MASTINAVTTGGGGIAVGGDTSGVIALQKDGTTFATGNQYGIGLGTAVPSSGIGIAFPATQSASSNANTLDDYEEGTWTPVIDSSTTGTGRATQVNDARYTKVGNLCYFSCYINLSTVGSGGSGNTYIYGLPFTSASNAGNALQAVYIGYFDTFNANTIFVTGFVSNNATFINLQNVPSANTGVSQLAFSTYMKAGATFIISGSYQTA